jgi:Leucine-rich repeat (LRR) protein
LDNNGLTEIPKSVYKLKNLKYLSLKSNKLSSIADEVCMLKNLEVLDLRGNYFKEYNVAILKVLLPKCRILY